MSRVLEYAARHHHRRGTVYGNASLCMAGLVLMVPITLHAAASMFHYIMRQPLACMPCFRLEPLVLDAPLALSVGIPLVGMLLGTAALSLRCKRQHAVVIGVMVHIAGLIAAIGAVLVVG